MGLISLEGSRLLLEFLRVLIWPLVLTVALLAFRSEIVTTLKRLKEITSPLGGAKFFQDGVEKAQEYVEKAQEYIDEAQPGVATSASASRDSCETSHDPEHAPSEAEKHKSIEAMSRAESTRSTEPNEADSPPRAAENPPEPRLSGKDAAAVLSAFQDLQLHPDMAGAREVLKVNSAAAVLLSFIELEQVARAANVIQNMRASERPVPPQLVVRNMDAPAALAHGVRKLSDLRNRVAHGLDASLGIDEAEAYIEACEEAAETVRRIAVSKLSHPSRSASLQQWL